WRTPLGPRRSQARSPQPARRGGVWAGLPQSRPAPAPPRRLIRSRGAAGCERAAQRWTGRRCRRRQSRRPRRLGAALSCRVAGRRRGRPERAPGREPRAFVSAPRGLAPQNKPELQKVMEKRKRDQVIKQKEEEAQKKKSDLEIELLKRQQKLEQHELEKQKLQEEQENTPEFVKVKGNLRRTGQEVAQAQES
uniref:Family with sequence similarity 107 member B n=1 Tax=Felis catus TaxID=9685 RepID=A0ABI7XVP4_FELCA